MSSRRPALAALLAAALIGSGGLAACSPTTTSSHTGRPHRVGSRPPAASCSPSNPSLHTKGQLTVATDKPAYDPWFSHNDPTNGKGYESAVAYAVAKKLGFTRGQVHWVVEKFNNSYQPGAKPFDFDINQISITSQRAKAVTFSTSYYDAAQAVIVLKSSKYAHVTSLAGLKGAKLGAQVGTTSLQAIDNQIKPSTPAQIYQDTNTATKALQNGQVDGIVADLPSAYYITAAVLSGSTIAGQFQPEAGQQERFGMLFAKGSAFVTCVDGALKDLKSSGQLAKIQSRWLSQATGVPKLS